MQVAVRPTAHLAHGPKHLLKSKVKSKTSARRAPRSVPQQCCCDVQKPMCRQTLHERSEGRASARFILRSLPTSLNPRKTMQKDRSVSMLCAPKCRHHRELNAAPTSKMKRENRAATLQAKHLANARKRRLKCGTLATLDSRAMHRSECFGSFLKRSPSCTKIVVRRLKSYRLLALRSAAIDLASAARSQTQNA